MLPCVPHEWVASACPPQGYSLFELVVRVQAVGHFTVITTPQGPAGCAALKPQRRTVSEHA